MKQYAVVLFFCILMSFSASAQVLLGDVLERLRKEAPVAWETFFHSWNESQVSYTEEVIDAGKTVEKNSATMLLVYPGMTHQRVDILNNEVRVTVFNDRYRFALEKGQAESTWAIAYVEPIQGVKSYEQIDFPVLFENNVVSIELFIANTFARGFMFSLGDWFPVIFRQPEFRILETKEISEDGETLVWVKYEYNPPLRNTQLLRGGEVVLMPSHFWLIKRANVKLSEPDGKIVDAQINCEYDFLSVPVPRLKSHTMYVKDYDLTFQRVFDNYTKKEDIDSVEFTLSHYGLPEPDFGERRTNWFRYALMVVGILLITIAFWRMYRERKEKKS